MPAATPNPTDLSFEDAMERLEGIVSAMEGERMPLAEMISAYEEGARLLQLCRSRIDVARQRVEIITTNLENPTKATLSSFDPSTHEEAEPTKTRATTSTRRTVPAKPTAPDDDDDIRLF